MLLERLCVYLPHIIVFFLLCGTTWTFHLTFSRSKNFTASNETVYPELVLCT